MRDAALCSIYDGFAHTYAEGRGVFDVSEVLEELVGRLPAVGELLDLGCGAGEPVATTFLARRWRVTGVDASHGMLVLAEKYAPSMSRVLGDMRDVDLPAESFDAVTAVYSLFHLPGADQPLMFRRMRSWLRPGGVALFTYASRGYTGSERFEGTLPFMGYDLPYSHGTPEELAAQLCDAGFDLVEMSERTIGGESMLWVTVRRPGSVPQR